MIQTSKHLITTKADIGVCRSCRSLILVGTSEGLATRVDPYPADRDTEAVALILGRWTYTLTPSRHLIRRTGGAHRGPALIEHRCGEVLTAPRTPHG